MTPAQHLDAHAADLVVLLRRLVGVPTANPPGENYDAMTALLVRELRAAGLAARRFRIPTGRLRRQLPRAQWGFPRFNVLGTLAAPGAKQTLHFNAHYDVVPAAAGWRHGNAFSGAVEGGWIYGRGTADMKGSIAALLLALRALRAAGVRPRLNLEVSFTADEETDSALGAGWLVEHAPIRPDFAVVMEGGEGGTIGCGHNGVVWLNVTVHGRAAHGSLPHLGVNALEKMSALVLALDTHKRALARRRFRSPDGRVLTPTLNIGGVFASGPGGKINTVPALASFSIDRRVVPGETVAAAERELRAFLAAAAKKIPQCRITVEKVSENHPCFTPPTGPFCTALAGCVRRVRGGRVAFGTSTGFNDMHFFAAKRKIPTLGYGPGGQREHGTDERARISELVRCAKIYAELMATFAG